MRGAVVGLTLATIAAAGCSQQGTAAGTPAMPAPAAVTVSAAAVVERPIASALRVTGSLVAAEQAEVSAETAGRVVETPVERGTRVDRGAMLVKLSDAEARAQAQEAEANVAQIEARLGLSPSQAFEAARVPEVLNAKAALELAEAEFARVHTLLGQKVVSQSEHDQRQTQVEAARQQHRAAVNAAEQSYRALEAARARLALARKALEDTSVRAPFAGLVAERRVSVGDYVTRGTPVAVVVRIDTLRLELTVPESSVGAVKAGQPVSLAVEAYPNRRFGGTVRYISPALRADQRALIVEALVANRDGLLKPGLFASAEIGQAATAPALFVPASAVRTSGGVSRVFVIRGDRVEERIVTLGRTDGELVQIVNGLRREDRVAVGDTSKLTDGAIVDSR